MTDRDSEKTFAETERALLEVIDEILAVFASDTPIRQDGEGSLEKAARLDPRLTDKIVALNRGLVSAWALRESQPESTNRAYEFQFRQSGAEDPLAVRLAADILMSRMSYAPGLVDRDKNPFVEVLAMENELSKDEDLTDLTAQDIVRAVLEGKLRVGHVPDEW